MADSSTDIPKEITDVIVKDAADFLYIRDRIDAINVGAAKKIDAADEKYLMMDPPDFESFEKVVETIKETANAELKQFEEEMKKKYPAG